MSATDDHGGREAIDEEALDWALRMADPAADWDAFSAWLEADPARSERYDRAVFALDAATAMVREQPLPPPPLPQAHDPDVPAPAIGRRRWLGGAMAAALVGAVGLGIWQERDRSYTVATAAGQQRDVRLADGSSIALAGGTRVRLDPARPRSATVEAGQALFRIRHDAAAPFRVRAGALDLTDLGTVFDVRLLGAVTQVAVAEGAVMVDPRGAKLRLDPGQAVVADGGRLRRRQQPAADVGTWRDGRLTYDDATLHDVAEDLSRQLGLRITAASAVAGRPFNGTLETRALRDDPAALGALLGVVVRRSGDGWTLDVRR